MDLTPHLLRSLYAGMASISLSLSLALMPLAGAALPSPKPEEPDPAKEPMPSEQQPSSPDLPDLTDRQRILIEADRFHQQGRLFDAERLYRKAKGSFTGVEFSDRPDPYTDPAQLSPAGQVYWREAQAGQELNLATRMRVPLQLLSQEYPEFIPGHLRYAEVLVQQEQLDQALDVLEQATTLYPDQPELAQMRVRLLASAENWLEASIAARQFALLNPEGASATDFLALADQYQEKYRARLRNRLTGNTIANILTGTAGFLLTGNLYGPLTAVDSTVLLLRGESAVGESVAKQAQAALPLVEDEAIVAYVNQIGQKLVRVAGRDEFEYEFYVVNDPSLNAFALPGGKVFVNAGAIAKTESEAELAGLIAHELSHAVLSHGFQLVTGGNATANIFQFVPYAGGLATQIAVSSYSRDMERQADAMATRMLTAAGYAADGLYNLMGTLGQENTAASVEWLSSHPDTPERLRNIATQIEQNGYNRYTYEGVENHLQMRQRVLQFLPAQKESALSDNQ